MRRKRMFLPTVWLVLFLLLFQTVAWADMTLVYDGQVHTYTGSTVNLQINGSLVTPDVPPVIIENRTLIPLRAVLEPFGAACSFSPEEQLVTVILEDQKLELTINSATAVLNDTQTLTMDVPAKIINDRTMIPLRFVSESLGLVVNWDPDTATAYVDAPEGGIWQVSTLTGISLEAGETSSQVLITSNEDITDYTTFTLTGPQRIVVDINHTEKGSTPASISGGSTGVTGVRSSQFSNYPAVTRVVVDLSEAADYTVTPSADGRTLTVTIACGTNSTPTVTPTPSPTPSTDPSGLPALSEAARDKLVVIDPGHGGTDPGAIGYDDDGNVIVEEADINLAVATRVNSYLQAAGVQTLMTRTTDVMVPLMEIPEIANEADADLFLSIHCNSLNGTPSANGTETLYLSEGANPEYGISGRDFAQIVQDELIEVLGTTDRGLKYRPNLVVLKYTNMPAALAELAFITNPSDREKLMSSTYQDAIAQALARAVILALNESVS